MWIWSALILLQVIFINYLVLSSHETITRQKRNVIYPKGGLFKLVIGIGIPVKLGTKQSMACGWNFQFQYGVPTNITQLKEYPPIIAKSRQKRTKIASDRTLAYLGVESIMNRYNMDGKSCLLRSICENAVHPLNHSANGLYGQLLHIFLTPNYGLNEIDPELDPIYVEAQKSGEYGLDCLELYSKCKSGYGIFDLITLIDY